MSGLRVWTCRVCGHDVFPERLLCPRCGASERESTEVEVGVVEDETLVRRAPGGPLPTPVRLGTVRAGGVPVPARLEPGAEVGSTVRLEYRDGVLVATPTET